MEEQVFKIMTNELHPMAGHDWLIGLDSLDCKFCSNRITSHVIEFIEWIIKDPYTFKSNYIDCSFYNSDTRIHYTLEELYQYWLKNVKHGLDTRSEV
jgi:hypothetical protein